MYGKSIHEIEITHDWSNHESWVDEAGFVTTIERCRECGVMRRNLNLDSGPETPSNDSTPEDFTGHFL